MLNANGTWDDLSNLSGNATAERVIEENPKEYKKPSSCKAESKGLGNAYRVYSNNEIWRRISPSELNEETDLTWRMKRGDAYAMVILEEIEINKEDLSQIAFDNANELSAGLEMVKREYRHVNGKDVVIMEMAGKMGSINVSYYSYYFSNENGSIQFHTLTGIQVLDKYRNTFDELLSGLINKLAAQLRLQSPAINPFQLETMKGIFLCRSRRLIYNRFLPKSLLQISVDFVGGFRKQLLL